MKRTSLLVLLLAVGFLVWATPVPSVTGSAPKPSSLQSQQSDHQQPMTPSIANRDQNQDHPPSRDFTGKIISMQGVCVLKNVNNRILYQLDDQQEAHLFNGKVVTVTGMLDKSSQTILVESIRPVSSTK